MRPPLLLLTGASGLLGATLTLKALDERQNVIAAYGSKGTRFESARNIRLDLKDLRSLRALIKTFHPECVIHCAALTEVDRCETEPGEAYSLNVESTRAIAETIAEIGGSMVYISTDAVFSGARGDYSEDDEPCPCNVYGQTKVEAERVVRATLERHLIVRTNMYGWNLQQKRSLAEWALYHLEQGNPIPGFTDVTFNALFVNDLATLILRMLEVGASGTYHLGASNSCSKFEFVRTVASVFGLNPELIRPASIEEIPFKAPRPRHTSLLSTKASAFLGCSMPSILAGIQTFARAREEGYVSRLKSYGVF